MSNFIQKELCPFCNQETDVLYVDLNELGYSLECLSCGEIYRESNWRGRTRRLRALKEQQEEPN